METQFSRTADTKGMRRLNDLIERIESYNPEADIDLVRKAYVYSSKVHKGQNRKSGEPYFVHPLEVANILAELRQDASTIASGFLHDTLEDTLATANDLEELFGHDVAFLVDGVTKIGKISFSSQLEHQAENFRKMLMAMAKDIRVIIIKLADRLHNMRTLHHLSTAKQEEIARETKEIYAPLANRLGVMWLRCELEDLALKYLKPQIYEKLEKEMRRFRKEKEKYIDNVVKLLKDKLATYGLVCEVSGRLKHLAGIYRKMEKDNLSFDQVHDIIAFRILVDEVSECYEALGLIHALWKPVPGRFKDFVAMPKENMYQSLHTTVIGPNGERVEIQIRTREMHRTAEQGIAAHWKYKEGGKIDEKDEMRFRWLRQLLEWQQELKDPTEFMESVKEDLFDETVYVFTPKGEVKSFVKGATPVDFAYEIHSEVGHRCVGAKVGGRIVPLKYQLHSGDTVEILTNKNSKPNKDWLGFTATSRARNQIRKYLKIEERQKTVDLGREMVEAELKKYHASIAKVLKNGGFDGCIKQYSQGTLDNLFANIAIGNLTPRQVALAVVSPEALGQVTPPVPEEEGTLKRIFRRVSGDRAVRPKIRIGGYDDVLTTFAQCCDPVPGDPIIGFITRGKGVTVHASDCPMILASEEERLISVEWDHHPKGLHTAKVRTVCEDHPGLLAKLSSAITQSGINITEAQIKTEGDNKAVNVFTVTVEDLDQLRKLIHKMEEVEGVISVERVRGNGAT